MIFVTGGAFQGKTDFVRNKWPGTEILDQLHILVKEKLDAGEDPAVYIQEIIEKNPDIILISNMIGSGIISMDPAENKWREVHGRLCCDIAARADEVYLVTCGIGQEIK